jgi:predicted permease
MGRTFAFPPGPSAVTPDFWIPIAEPIHLYRGRHYLFVVARLRPGVTRERAQADMTRVAEELTLELPELNRGHGARVVELQGDLVRDARPALLLLLGGVTCLVLIGCSNVAGLLLARGLERRQDIGVRLAIGASRLDIARQLLAEGGLLAIAGSALGLATSYWVTRLIPSMVPHDVLALDDLRIDTTVLLFALTMTMVTALLCGVAPIVQFRRLDISAVLQPGARTLASAGHPRLRRMLVVAEVALTLVLGLAAGLMIRGLLTLEAVDPGFPTGRLLSVSLALPGARYPSAPAQRQFFADTLVRASALPGVTSVAATNAVPLSGDYSGIAIAIEGRQSPPPGQEDAARFRVVSTGFFRTMGIPILAGRSFAASDARRAVPIIRWFAQQPKPEGFDAPQAVPVGVVNSAMAREYWPGRDPIGRRFSVLFSPWITVVGVAEDTRNTALKEPPVPEFYLSDLQEPQSAMSLLVRTTGNPVDVLAPLRSSIWQLDADLAITSARTMDDFVNSALGLPRLTSSLLGAFALLALALMTAGIYGLMAFTTSQRLPEIGVRLALGADSATILRMVVGQGLALALAGMLLGLVSAAALVRIVERELFGAPVADPWTWIGVLAILLLAVFAACWYPARRASRVDPVITLRSS